MKFLANENFPVPSVRVLRDAGFEVDSIAEKYSGISDLKVIEIARQNNQVILTFDKDYGEILFKYKFESPPAIVFFRHKGNVPEFAGTILKNLLQKDILKVEGFFTVIEQENIRQRKYV